MSDLPVPFDRQAEESVIAAAMVDDVLDSVSGIVQPRDFHSDACRWAYEACLRLWARGQTVNQVTVAHEMGEQLQPAGGLPWLSRIIGDLPTAIGVEHYAEIVARDSGWRDMIQAGSRIVADAYKAGADLEAGVSRARQLIDAVIGEGASSGKSLGDVLGGVWDTPDRRGMTVRTGYPKLDELLAGLHPSDLVIVAARPSMGKSGLLMNIAHNAMSGQNAHVAMFTLEMASSEYAVRLLSRETGIDGQRVRLGLAGVSGVSEIEERRLMDATATLSALPMMLDDRMYVSPTEMRGALRRARQRMGGLDLVLVDYLQLMGSDKRRENRVQEVTDISRGLKAIAREFGVPVVAAAQLSRAVEARPDKQPQLSDLRESGAIEQDADVVAFLYREDAYSTPDQWAVRSNGAPYPQGLVKVIVAKHRNGPTGAIWLRFDAMTSRFSELREREEVAQPEGPAPWAR